MRLTNSLAQSLFLSALLALGGCATVDLDQPKEISYAIKDTADTRIGRDVAPRIAEHPGESGFFMLFDGIDALTARVKMAEVAEKTLDAQYYLIRNDEIGKVFIATLLQAADRGVRVRLLLDDILTQGYDAGMVALDSHPNFEIRIFNPFGARSNRYLGGLSDLGRVNRRMHNKSFTVDNQMTIIGGRNIANEYFSFDKAVNFGDVDVLGIGPVVNDVSTMFDKYWNAAAALPVTEFANIPDDTELELAELRIRLDKTVQDVKQTDYAAIVLEDLVDFEKRVFDGLLWAPHELAYDSPRKVDASEAEESTNITTKLVEVIDRADKEVIIISPYFVPRKNGIKFFQKLIDRGLSVTVVTNSLAANNHGIVHSGYAPSRKKLLEMGVKLYEYKVNTNVQGVERGGSGAELATLHTKAFLVDRKYSFIGSFNWDPRSVNLNTELGVIIESETLGEMLGYLIDRGVKKNTYQLALNRKGRIRWVDNSGPTRVVYNKEPDTTWWRRAKANMGKILPIRGQL